MTPETWFNATWITLLCAVALAISLDDFGSKDGWWLSRWAYRRREARRRADDLRHVEMLRAQWAEDDDIHPGLTD